MITRVSEEEVQKLCNMLNVYITQDSDYCPLVHWHERKPTINKEQWWWESNGMEGGLPVRIDSEKDWTEKIWEPL